MTVDLHVRVVRLGTGDTRVADEAFSTMTEVFGEDPRHLSASYVDGLLARTDFWAYAALVDDAVVGGLTAHTLPMTRAQRSEVFLYDLAVRPQHQRRGIGRALVERLMVEAAAADIDVVFVPADDDDVHALDFYRSIGGTATPVTFFTFGAD